MKIVEEFKKLIARLFSLKDTPHAIAGGVAIGVFMGFTPLFGLKTLLSLGVAYAVRCNPIAAVIAVSLHDIVTPLWPVLLRLEYDMGYWVLSHPHVLPPRLEPHHIHWGAMLNWDAFIKLGLPLIVGSLFFAIPMAVIFYFITLGIILGVRRRRERHAGKEPSP